MKLSHCFRVILTYGTMRVMHIFGNKLVTIQIRLLTDELCDIILDALRNIFQV